MNWSFTHFEFEIFGVFYYLLTTRILFIKVVQVTIHCD